MEMSASKILMCEPSCFNVIYEINPWMNLNANQVDVLLAHTQWQTLYKALINVADVDVLEGATSTIPDLVFTANGGKIFDDFIVLSNFKNAERKLEEPIFERYFAELGKPIIKVDHAYEGEGDHLSINGRHWLGYGFRTDVKMKPILESLLNTRVHGLELIDERWYHLDTCFAPLSDDTIVWFPPAFSETSQKHIRECFDNSIEVDLEDALRFACNLVEINKHIFVPTNKHLSQQLAEAGFEVHEFNLSEFMKSGGAAKCLTLFL